MKQRSPANFDYDFQPFVEWRNKHYPNWEQRPIWEKDKARMEFSREGLKEHRMTTLKAAIAHAEEFLHACANQDGEGNIAIDDEIIHDHKICCVRADYLQALVDAAKRFS
jgi:hypothetical protein